MLGFGAAVPPRAVGDPVIQAEEALLWVCVLAIVQILAFPWIEALTDLELPDLNDMGAALTPIVLGALGSGATKAWKTTKEKGP